MTRLTSDDIKETPVVSKLDTELKNIVGTTLLGVASNTIPGMTGDFDFKNLKAGVVPITSGEGVIRGFSESVKAISEYLGMEAFVTNSPDVGGIAEAMSKGADIIFMADDYEFIAYNLKTGVYSNNTIATAKGYISALELAMGTFENNEVLVIGAGRVGTVAVEILSKKCSKVFVTDIDCTRAENLASKYPNVYCVKNIEEAVRSNMNILDASPGLIDGEWVQKGAIISAPGIPYAFDKKGEDKAKIIIHDPLSIGVSAMAVLSARDEYF